jgi:hypothetical protein
MTLDQMALQPFYVLTKTTTNYEDRTQKVIGYFVSETQAKTIEHSFPEMENVTYYVSKKWFTHEI